jgi:hypothetical protein
MVADEDEYKDDSEEDDDNDHEQLAFIRLKREFLKSEKLWRKDIDRLDREK